MSSRSAGQQEEPSDGVTELEKLAAELDSQAFVSTMVMGGARRAHLTISNRLSLQLTENVYAAPPGPQWRDVVLVGVGRTDRSSYRSRYRGQRGRPGAAAPRQ